MELESEEDEDAIIERRRQLRQAIVNKYQQSDTTTPLGTSPPPPTEADAEAAGMKIEAELEEEGRRIEDAQGDKEMSGLTKADPKEEMKAKEELKKKKTNLSALRASIRNGDMFSDDYLFNEVHLVRNHHFYMLMSIFVCFLLLRIQQHSFLTRQMRILNYWTTGMTTKDTIVSYAQNSASCLLLRGHFVPIRCAYWRATGQTVHSLWVHRTGCI